VNRIGVTGHMNLTPETTPLVREATRNALLPYVSEGLTGISCLAVGADTIFAETALDLGGALEVILPASDYRERRVEPGHLQVFDYLTRRATNVRIMPYPISNRDAYEAANEALLDSCDRLIAVWDGQATADKGGTAAVIESAKRRNLPVQVIWSNVFQLWHRSGECSHNGHRHGTSWPHTSIELLGRSAQSCSGRIRSPHHTSRRSGTGEDRNAHDGGRGVAKF
jgi:hypothetical protein